MVARTITIQFTLHLNEATGQELARMAERMGRTEGDLISEAVEELVKRSDEETAGLRPGETLLDAWRRAGLVGCIRSGPPDLSTNPKYMEGFGE